MIREYIKGDEERLKFNDFSDPSIASDIFLDPSYLKMTICGQDQNDVSIIACWKEYAPDSYATFLLMSKDVSVNRCKELKKLLNDVTMRLRPKRVLTYSHDCERLNRWHEFLGFKKEDENGVLIEGKKFNKWVMSWV